MFAAEFEPAVSHGRRVAERAPVSIDGDIGKARRTLCKVVDISIHGARLLTYCPLIPHSMIWLTLPEAGSLAAEVRWAEEFAAGCRFMTALDPEVFERLVALNRAGR
ncbi:PilZ domain-containing protein [Sphingomonas kyungheensis]|uniref:PilZ domain-containing protein n=1 Tax=Sphingomonas kyungheensis TaxID=1069987 RepID=A0ABU8H1Y0_9SPHN